MSDIPENRIPRALGERRGGGEPKPLSRLSLSEVSVWCPVSGVRCLVVSVTSEGKQTG